MLAHLRTQPALRAVAPPAASRLKVPPDAFPKPLLIQESTNQKRLRVEPKLLLPKLEIIVYLHLQLPSPRSLQMQLVLPDANFFRVFPSLKFFQNFGSPTLRLMVTLGDSIFLYVVCSNLCAFSEPGVPKNSEYMEIISGFL